MLRAGVVPLHDPIQDLRLPGAEVGRLDGLLSEARDKQLVPDSPTGSAQ